MSVVKAFGFLEKLQKHNSKKWMDLHRDEWSEIRNWWKNIISDILYQSLEHDPDLWTMNPSRSLLRINSDLRYNKNRPLYKSYIGARFNPDSKVQGDSGYYVDFGAKRKELVFFCGSWAQGQTALQKAIRYKIRDHGTQLLDILSESEFKKTFPVGLRNQQLQRPPRGFDKDEEFIELIKQKIWAVGWRKELDINMSDEELIDLIVKNIRITSRFVNFFRKRNLAIFED